MQDNNTPIFRVSLANGASRDYTEQEYRDLHIADWLNENHSGKYNVFRLNDAAADSVTKDQQYVVSFTQDGQTKSKLYSGQDFMNLDMGNWLEQNHPGNYKIQSVRGYSDANLAADEDYWKKKADEQKAAIGQFEQDNHDFMFKHEMDKIVYDAGEGNIVDDNYMENDAKYRGLISQKQALQAEYSNNPYIKSIYKSEAEYADGKANEYDGILEEMRKKNPFLGESKQMQSGTQAENDEFKYFQQAKKLEKDVAKIFAIETIKAPGENGFADYMRNYAKAHGNTFSDVDFWSRGLTEISRNLNIRDIMKKLQAKGLDLNQLTEKDLDDNLTPGEKALLQGFARKAYAQAQRAEDMAPGYTAGRTAAESLGFMAEFLVTGAIGRGLGAAEEAGATGLKSWIARELRTGSANAIESSVKRGMINSFTKGGEKALTEGAKKAVRAASSVASGAYSAVARPLEQAVWHTALQPSTYRQISENLTQIQENGELIDAGNAIWGGVLDQLVENWSESMGVAVETVLGMPFKAAGWAGEKVLGKTTLGQWGKWLADSQAARVLYNAGFNGLIGEMGEEWLGNAARVGLGIMSKDEFKDFASWHEQLEMAASFAPMSLFGLGISAYAASKQAKDYKQTAEAMRGVLNRAGMTEDEIADIMDTKHTKKEIADALTPVIQRIVHGRQDNSVAFDDYVTTLKFAQASAMNEVLATAQSIERGKERDAMRNQIGQELGATSAEDERGKFTHVMNSERLDADGNPYELEAVTTVKDADGNEWFYMGNQGSQVVLKKMGEDGGKPMFLTQEQYAQRVESGEYTENTQLATQYLDQRIEQQRAEEERVRKNQEVQDNYSRIFAALQQNPEITVGTEDAPMTGTVVQVARDGVVVDFGKPVLLNGVTRPVHKLSLEQAGNALGIDAAMRSDEQMDRDSADQDDLNRKRISAYNNTFKDKDFTLNGDPYTFVRMFEAPYLDEDGTELVRVTATDAMGNDVELVLPLKDLEEQALTSEEQAQSDADQEDVNLSVTDQTTGSLKDFRGNDIPMRQNEKTGEEEVDKREFKRRDPEAYYRWNDSRRGGNTSDSMEAIQADIAVKSSEKDKLAAQKQSETDPDMRDELEAQITNLDNEINLLSGIYYKYDAASNFQQRQTEYAQRFADIKQRMLKAKTQEQYDELVEMQRQLSMDYFTEMRDAAQTLSLNQHAVELQQALNEMADLPVQVTTYARIEEDMINDQASRASIDKVLDKIASVQRENMATGSNLAIDGFHHNGKVYIFAEGNRTVADATVTYYHERQHDINKTNPKAVDDVLALANNDEQALYDTLTHIIGNAKSYEGASARVLADEIVAFTMEKAWTNPNYVDELKALGLSNELINIISTEYGRQQGTSEDLNQRSGDRTSYDGTGGQPNYRIDEQAQEGESGDEQLGSSQPGNEAEEVGLTEKTQKELAEKGLVMDGGVVMASALSDLKQATGYLTPNEISPEADAVAFSIRTKNAWAANYRKYPGSEERVIRALENLAERMAADELVSGVISQGDYKYGQKANGSFAGPLRTNIEYVVTFDMDTTCPRTFQYLNYVKQIEKRIGRPLTQTECIQLTEMMRMYGQQIPCVYCYSENKRQAMKQYYTDFMTSRQAVLNAATDEEALEHMYGHGTSKAAKESKDPAVALNEAAYKVFLEWRANRKSAYNPSLKMLWYQYSNDRNTVLSVLDQLYADGRIMTDLNDDIIAAVVDTELRINDKQAVKVVEDIVSEWKWDAIEGRQHSDYTPVDEDEWVVDPRTLSLWREMTAYAKSASQAKSVLRYVPYTDELKKLSQEQKDYINGMGGVRMHSSNDFRIDYVFDYFQFMADMAANKMFGHTYTKSPEFVRIFGNSGYKINMSIAAYEDENGNIRMNEDEGFNWDEAKRLREAFPNAGVMLMATSDNQIQMALDSDWIDMFIPFHASSLPKAVWYNMRMWQDYSTVQNEAFLNGDEMKAALIADGVELPKKIKATEVEQMYLDHFKIKTIIGTTGKKKGKRLRPHFLPGPTVVDGQYVPGHNNDPELYKQLCIEYGVHPRFYGVKVKDAQGNTIDITEHPNYIKCIKETSRTDSPQTPIQFNFDQPSEALGGKSPIEYAFDELQVRAAAEMEAAGAPVRDIYKSLEKDTFGIVPQFIDTIIKHKEKTGKDYPLDYITPDSRKWFLTERKALEEAYKDVETIPYHRNEYDVNGEPMMREADNAEDQAEIQKALDLVNGEGTFAEEGGDIRYSIRTKPAPKSTGIGYKVFYLKDGKLYPPMVANPDGAETPVGVWLDADAAPQAATSKTGRKKVKAGGKGTQGGSGTLAYRPGWHLGEIPYALQFNRGPKVDNPLGITGKNGKVIKVGKYFPANFVWAEVEYAKDVDYQDEAMSYGYNKAGNFQHSLAGLPKVPEDGSYTYRTNANPATDPWIITGAMKVNRILTDSEVDELVSKAGREPQAREDNPKAFEERMAVVNRDQKRADGQYADAAELDDIMFRLSNNNHATISKWLDKWAEARVAEVSKKYGANTPRESFEEAAAKQKEDILNYLDKLNDSTMQLAWARWFCTGAVQMGAEDMPKVRQAVKIAKIHKVDPLQYDSPMSIINQWPESVKDDPINPDEVPTLHKVKELPDGIVIYDVDESEESRKNMREIINTHFGKDCSPWCLLQGDGNGKLTKYSADYWYKTYTAYTKQVAFKNGKLVAFSANSNEERLWWDRQDSSHHGIPVIGKIKGDKLGRSATMEYSPEDGSLISVTNIVKGNKKDGKYMEWFSLDNETPRVEETFDHGYLVGRRVINYENGQIRKDENYENGSLSGRAVTYFQDGQIETDANYVRGRLEGPFTSYHENGQVYYTGTYERGDKVGRWQTFYKDGQMSADEVYAKSWKPLESVTYYPDGSKKSESHSVSRPYGFGTVSEQEWDEQGRLVRSVRMMESSASHGYYDGDLHEITEYEYNELGITMKKVEAYRGQRGMTLYSAIYFDDVLQKQTFVDKGAYNYNDVIYDEWYTADGKLATVTVQKLEKYNGDTVVDQLEYKYDEDGNVSVKHLMMPRGLGLVKDEDLLVSETRDLLPGETIPRVDKLYQDYQAKQLNPEEEQEKPAPTKKTGKSIKDTVEETLAAANLYMDEDMGGDISIGGTVNGEEYSFIVFDDFTYEDFLQNGYTEDELGRANPEQEEAYAKVQDEINYYQTHGYWRDEADDNTPMFRTADEREKLFKDAKDEFGTTRDFREAGYLLPDGSMLDFSEKNNGGEPGRRGADHRDIARVINDRSYGTMTEYLDDFINEGAIRLIPESGAFSIAQQPTKEQKNMLRNFIYRYNGEVEVEIYKNGHSVADPYYRERTSPTRVLNDIDAYFKDGTIPEGNAPMFRMVEITPETRQEMEQIEAIARVNGTYLKAPNGADTKLNPEQWSMVRTKAFKNWFGDWENDPANASKIVDENGEPIVVYRGQNWDKKDGKMTSGLFVSLDEDFAEGYGDVKPLFVRSVNPFNGEKDAESLRQFVEENFDELQAEYEEFYDEGEGYEDVDSLMDALNENWWIAYEYSDILRNEIIRRGYDSIFIREDADNIWLTSPDQIKSATNNNGSFDPNDPDIRYRVVPGGESMAERAYRESGAFSFTGSERINSIDDVAFIFRELENYATENSFIVLVKDGMPTILHTGIGNMTSTFIDTAAAIAGYNDFAPDTVYLVHNHPSGNLVASAADINELAKLKDIFSGVPVSGIILDTVSGNYGYFDEGINIEKSMPEEGDEFPVKVLSFDKVVFDKEFKSQLNERKIAGPYDVAAFLSAHRLGKGKKLGVLLLNNAQYIVANYVTNDNSLTTRNADRIARQVANVAVHSNANRAIMFGNFNFDDKSLRSFSRSFKKASGETMSLLDVVQMNPDGGYVSVNNDTLHGRNDGTMFRVTPAQDQEYRQAYENNDTAKAEQMVKDAFNAAYPNNKLGARSFYKGKNGEWENQIAGYFTDDFEFANHYGSGDVKECFLVMENPYEYDFKESGSDGDFEGLDGEIRETRGVMQDADAEAREKGLKPYDGYILRNVGEGYGPGSYVVDDYIVKDPKQVKSAEPFTFDDNGELIPLSQRFNPESDDVRFRISARSSEGENLSEGQQAYFANSKAVDEKGNLLTLYHGTPRAGFNEFRSGFFTTSKKDADSYGGNDREGKLYDPNERASSEKVIAGDFRLGYMTFDSEEDRADFLAKHPLAEDAMTLSQLNEAIDNANYDGDAELEKELESKRDAYKKIEKDYRDYEFGHLVTTTWNDLLANPSAYTENDFRRAFLAYDSNAVFDGIDDMDHEDRIDAYIDALNYAVEESAAEGGDALSIEFYSRVPRNGEGTRAKDMRHRTYKVYINVENPFEMDAKGRHSEFESGDVYESIKNAMADPQYDGVIVRNWRVGRYQELGDVVVPKDKNQIKLTTNINPTESDDIRFRMSEDNSIFADNGISENGLDGEQLAGGSEGQTAKEDAMFSIRQKDVVNKAMSGLQNFNDDEVNDMLMDTFEAVTPEIRAKIVDNAPETGYDFGKATVRTFADLAEREDDLTAEEWNAIATLRDNMKDALGIDVLSLNDTLWSMYQTSTFGERDILSAARRAIVADKLGHSPADEAKRQQAEDELRFSIREGMESTSAAEMYNRATNYWMNRLKESYVDMNESVNDLVAAIEKATGIDAEAFEDVRLALNQQSSKGLAAMTKYTADYLEPLWSAIHDVMEATGMSYDDVVRYVMLKHAVERNDVFARRDAKAFYQAEFDNVVNPLRKDRKQLERDRKKALAAGDLMTANDCDNKIQAIDLQIAAEQKKLDRHNKMVDNGTAAKYHEYRENDYGGLTSMYSEYPGLQPREYYKTDEEYNQAARKVRKPLYQTVGEMEVSALGEVDAMEQRTSGDEFDKLWEKINAATKATLESQYKSNVISKAQYDAARDQFQYYVPLRGFKDTTAEDIWTYFNASHSGSFSPALLGARGRKSEAENPFNWIGTMASSAIAQNLKNESKMALYYFIANRPNQDLVSVKDVWYQFDAQATADYQAANPGSKKRIFTAVYPPFNESLDTDAAKQAYDLWEESMEQQAQNGLAYRGTNKLDIKDDVAFIDAKEAPQHIIRMKLRGKDVSLIINGNPRAAQAINGLLNIETEGGYQKIFGPILRWMSAVNTSYNPEFWISNMQRDLLFATMGMDIKGDGASNLFKNLVNPKKIMKMMRAYEDGTLGNSEVENYYREFAESGAITGFTVVSGNETWEKEIADFLDPSVLTKIKDSKFMKFWQDLGEAVEQMARFSAYMTARKSGKDIIESTNAAKEITVNFNRKGSGRHISVDELKTLTTKSGRHLNDAEKAAVFVMSLVPAYGRRMIMFFNAATQGLNAMYKLWKKNPKRFAGWMTGYFAVGVMQAVLHALLDDDDDYMDMPEYTKRNNLLLGYDGIYLKWAMPQEARMFYAFGDMAVNHIMGRTPNKILAGEMLSAMADVMPLSATDGVTGLLPSAAQPFIELYTNKDFTGARIYNDMRFLSEDERSRTPNHPNALPNTGKIFVNVSKVLNEISGGNDWDAGFINIHPESIQHVVEGAGGGLLTTLNKVYETVGGAIDKAAGVPITGEELSVRRFPFLNRLLQVNDERSRNSHVGELFYYYKAEAEHTKSKISKFRKNGDSDAMSDLMDSKEYEIYMIYKSYEKLMRSFDDQIKIEEDKDEKKALMREQDQYRKDMIREISELE